MSSNSKKIIVYHDITEGLRAERTKEEYRRVFGYFLQFRNSRITDLLQLDPKDVEELIASYLKHLNEDRHLSHSFIILQKSAIIHFFTMNRVVLNKDWISKFVKPAQEQQGQQGQQQEDRAYKDEEIQRLIEASDERLRVVFLLMAATGMRIGAVNEIRLGHLIRFPNPLGLNSYIIKVYNLSALSDRYYCFSTPELTAAIDNYLAYRKRFGDELKPQDPLIREQFDIDSPWAAKHPKPMARGTFNKIISRTMKKAGIYADVSGSVMQTNGFRKRAMTKMIQAKVDYDCREYLIGHRRSRGLNVHYDRTSETERFMEWSKSINLLTIDPTNRLQQENQELRSERITKEDLEEIRKQWMIDLQKERALISLSEWNALKEQMNKLKEVLYPQK